MNNPGITYAQPTLTGIATHGWDKPSFLRDIVDEADYRQAHLPLEAQVRSGDYFVTLAMNLELLARRIEEYQVRTAVEDIVSDLIYLQDRYDITKSDR